MKYYSAEVFRLTLVLMVNNIRFQVRSAAGDDAGVLAVPGELLVAALRSRQGVARAHDVHHRHDQREVP